MPKTVKIGDKAYELAKRAVDSGEVESICEIITRAVETYVNQKNTHERAIACAKELVHLLKRLQNENKSKY
jgi:hypothetical protein